MKRYPIILFFCFLGLSIQAQDLRKQGRYWVGTIKKTFQVEPGGTLHMDKVRGDIVIEGWEGREIIVHETKRMDIFSEKEARSAMEEAEKGYRLENNILFIGGDGFDRSWIKSRFEIQIPRSFEVDVNTRGGSIQITRIDGTVTASSGGGELQFIDMGGKVEARTGGGNIRVEQARDLVNAKTGGGDIQATDCAGSLKIVTGGGKIYLLNTGEASVTTGGGDVDIRGAAGSTQVKTGGGNISITDAKGDVTVTTGGGAINIKNIEGDFSVKTGGGAIIARTIAGALQVRTGGGNINLKDIQGSIDVATGGGNVDAEITLTDFTRPHSVKIVTGGGDIGLSIPGRMPATISAVIRFYRRTWEDYKITSDFPLKQNTYEEGRYTIIKAEGEINGGGETVDLKTGGGNIRIKSLK
ncbi:MAG TPA: hypothetical protein ENN03_03295 [bacterium]|nr:hypothetical protein [bacterium]